MSMLELRRVSKVYGQGTAGVHALADVRLSVDEGSMVAVMGPSGSGKSTLLTSIPVANLLWVLVGMPLIAVLLGWLLAAATRPASAASHSNERLRAGGSSRTRRAGSFRCRAPPAVSSAVSTGSTGPGCPAKKQLGCSLQPQPPMVS
jgi:ABC transporter